MTDKNIKKMPMNMRDVIDLVEIHGDQKPIGRYQEIQALIGREAKELISYVNLAEVNDVTFGIAIVDLVKDIYSRSGLPQPEFLEKLYGIDDRADELDLDKKEAEINKLNAQASSASSK